MVRLIGRPCWKSKQFRMHEFTGFVDSAGQVRVWDACLQLDDDGRPPPNDPVLALDMPYRASLAKRSYLTRFVPRATGLHHIPTPRRLDPQTAPMPPPELVRALFPLGLW